MFLALVKYFGNDFFFFIVFVTKCSMKVMILCSHPQKNDVRVLLYWLKCLFIFTVCCKSTAFCTVLTHCCSICEFKITYKPYPDHFLFLCLLKYIFLFFSLCSCDFDRFEWWMHFVVLYMKDWKSLNHEALSTISWHTQSLE